MGYRLVRALARLLVAIFYRRVEVVGLERIPAGGPLILTANHHEALVDPMILLATVPRQLRPVAKAPLFRYPPIAPFLHLAGAIPVHRRQDPGSDPARNVEMFRTAIDTLRAGGAILIFPEGLSQAEPVLMLLRTGVARMLLGGETNSNETPRATLLPVGLIFHEPGAFRAGWALVLVGEPVPTDDCLDLYRTAPEEAVRRLTARLAEALRRLIVEAEDRQTLRLLEAVEAMRREESTDHERNAVARTHWMQRVMRAYRYLQPREPARIEAFRREVERYVKDLELAGLTGRQLARSYTGGAVWRYAVREGLSLLLGLPLALWGIANHLIPYQLTALGVRLVRPEPNVEATLKMCGGMLLFPLCWIGEGWTAWRLGGGWLLALFIASLLPTGFFALTWRERLRRFAQEARAFLRFLVDRDLGRRLLARRRALTDELTALARLVPDSVLLGETTEQPPHPTHNPLTFILSPPRGRGQGEGGEEKR